jgi:tetratricopeptide (TPR) repeat protein
VAALSLLHLFIGDALTNAGKPDEALPEYQKQLEYAQKLVDTDQENAFWQLAVCLAHERIGDSSLTSGKWENALVEYQMSLSLRLKAVDKDPNNTHGQFGLYDVDIKIGKLLLGREGRRDEALVAFNKAFLVMQNIADAKLPASPQLQDKVTFSYDVIGDAMAEAGDWGDALASYRAGLTVRERLAKTDPDNADWRHSSYNSVGNTLRSSTSLA